MTFAVPKAGDFIDSSAASVTGELATRIRIAKEQSFYINGHTPDKVQQVLSVYYDDMIRTLVTALVDACSSARAPKFGKPVPIVLSGGTTMPKGFKERFEKVLNESSFPLAISEIRMAGDPLTATAKGALVAALAE
jgi:tRNA A37 threonylcarbamoyltransferase TsaD